VQSSTDILIIEDNPDDYEACVSALKNDNNLVNKIIWCCTGDEGLDYLYGRGAHAENHPDIDACYSAGANSYVVKPVDLDGFIKAITRLREYWFEISVLPEVT